MNTFPKSNLKKYIELSSQYKTFTYESFDTQYIDNKIIIKYTYNIDNKFYFKPEISFYLDDFFVDIVSKKDILDSIFFNCGMVEMISYWKSACPKKVIIKPYSLNSEQISWWKNLYFNGLGEFFYINGIETDVDKFMNIESVGEKQIVVEKLNLDPNKVVVPIGGGKDSPVTLDLMLKNKFNVIPLIINPRGATINTLKAAGIEKYFRINRTIDKTLLQMNIEGFLNGHTPFSAMLAFYSIAVATITNSKLVALSNENSANESTVIGSKINHQYSKSFEFETDFRNYYKKYLCQDIEYFSFLRPISELQIAKIFASLSHYHSVFRSCNAGSKDDIWCGKCAKCLFTAIILSPFLEPKEICNIFEKDIFEDKDLLIFLHQLNGSENVKPFECVGTTNEVILALNETYKKYYNNNEAIPFIIAEHIKQNKNSDKTFEKAVNEWNNENYLRPDLVKILKNELDIR